MVRRLTAFVGPAYAAPAGRLFVADGTGAAETVVDVRSNRAMARVDVGDGPSDTEVDPASGRVLVPVAGGRALVAIDATSLAVVARYPLPGCDDADGVQVDVS